MDGSGVLRRLFELGGERSGEAAAQEALWSPDRRLALADDLFRLDVAGMRARGESFPGGGHP